VNDRLLTTREVASYLGFSPETVFAAVPGRQLQANCAGELRQHFPQRASVDHDALVMWLLDAP
jgi:predicted DNA-binding transcriptional regulator AlpA